MAVKGSWRLRGDVLTTCRIEKAQATTKLPAIPRFTQTRDSARAASTPFITGAGAQRCTVERRQGGGNQARTALATVTIVYDVHLWGTTYSPGMGIRTRSLRQHTVGGTGMAC